MQIHKEIDFSLIKVKKEAGNNLKQIIKQCNSAKTLKIKEKIKISSLKYHPLLQTKEPCKYNNV